MVYTTPTFSGHTHVDSYTINIYKNIPKLSVTNYVKSDDI